MTTKPKLTDDEWLAKYEAGEIELNLSHGFDRTHVAEVRAYELLRREYDDAIIGAVRLTRHSGVSWSEIGRALGLNADEAISQYRDRIGEEAERIGSTSKPEDPSDTALIRFMVQFRDDAVDKLGGAVKRAQSAGVSDDFISLAIDWSDDEARVRWPFPS